MFKKMFKIQFSIEKSYFQVGVVRVFFCDQLWFFLAGMASLWPKEHSRGYDIVQKNLLLIIRVPYHSRLIFFCIFPISTLPT